MKIGDTVTIYNKEWTVRPFTADEHESFEIIAEAYQLKEIAAKLQTLKGARVGTMREKLLKKDIERTENELKQYLEDGGGPREDLSEEESIEAYSLAAKLDMYNQHLENVRNERASQILVLEDQLIEAQEQTCARFMHKVLKIEDSIDEYLVKVTDEDKAIIEEVVALGKLSVGLSASMRRQALYWAQILETLQQSQNGNVSESKPQPQAAPKKPGKRGPSKKSSSKSKAGGSGRTTRPPQ